MINIKLDTCCKSQDYMTFVDANKMTYDGSNYRSDLFIKDGIHLTHIG